MNAPSFRARRATLDDLPVLRPLWSAGQLDALHLEKRLTDFQVAETTEGQLVAAIGLQVDGTHGLIHSECFLDAAQIDTLRPLFWERLLTVAHNRGLTRLWTLERIPFWHEHGFRKIEAEIKRKFPPAFGDPDVEWLTLKLKEELTATLSMDHEFEQFRQTAQQDRERMMRQGRIMKGVATVLALTLFILVIIGGVLLFKKNRLRVPFSGSTPTRQR